jgi:hypothetical protein
MHDEGIERCHRPVAEGGQHMIVEQRAVPA